MLNMEGVIQMQNKKGTIIKVILLAIALLIFLFPIFWMVSASFKTKADVFSFPPVFFANPTLENYRDVLSSEFPRYILNSVIIAVSSVFISVLLGTPAAYTLSRFHFKIKEATAFWILSTRMAPPVAVALPMFLMMKTFGLLDTHICLIILYTTFNLSFVIWMMRGFFDEIPRSIDEAGLVDGCSRYSTFVKVVLPLVGPGLVATAIFCLIFSWNEFFFALTMSRTVARTVPVAVQGYIGIYGLRWGEMSAAATLATFPILIFAALMQKHLVRGLTLGAVKQ